ncbi:hypothetical protein CICRMM096B_09230 [Citrobacter cronae]|uniref:Uncharacterized protein n=1 Tax=Citrobacter werkmanii TaxID=67827 RepID=A0A9N8CN31_9ENTR|nr:Uncharacterised protein [Citrobacter werkmanii]BBV31688.1 hypothetical protein STW0522CIT01_31770 [Citrobacter freundii]GAS74622.1 hypothetical protein NGUA40_04262 [Salmonella enterica]CAB5523804.1 Uncharacterised protein [Citrobacter werkmanii]CAB5530475.1 Uncharacterised protein [Citrobacter werkmanii]
MLTILPQGCNNYGYSEFYQPPGLTLSAVGICLYTTRVNPTTCIQLNTALD